MGRVVKAALPVLCETEVAMAKDGRRGHQEGSIYQRTDGRWSAAIDCGWKNGKRQRKQFYGETRKEVADKLTKALRDQQLGLPVAIERQTVGTFLKSWLSGVRLTLRPKTFRSYQQIVTNHLVPAIGRRNIAKLSPADVQQMLSDATAKGLSARSVHFIRVTS